MLAIKHQGPTTEFELRNTFNYYSDMVGRGEIHNSYVGIHPSLMGFVPILSMGDVDFKRHV